MSESESQAPSPLDEEVKRIRTQLLQRPLLHDIPLEATFVDVELLIGREEGTVVCVVLVLDDGTRLDILVDPRKTVRHLMTQIARTISRIEEPHMGTRGISWKKHWARYDISYNGERMEKEHKLLRYQIGEGSEICFVRKPIIRKEKMRQTKFQNRRPFMQS